MAASTTLGGLLSVGIGAATIPSAAANGVAMQTGDLFAGLGNGSILHYNSTGTLVDTLSGQTTSYETGMCFDGASNLYATDFGNGQMTKFDGNGNILTYPWGGSFATPESCVVDASNQVYVGSASGGPTIKKLDSSGNLLATYSPQIQNTGIDWIDLATDQCTMYYTSEGSDVKRFNVCSNAQLSDLTTTLPSPCFALRIRQNGEILVACTSEVARLNSAGSVIQTYPTSSLPGASSLFAMNLDPDGTSFWTADDGNGNIYRVDIATGRVLTQFSAGQAVWGLALVGGSGPVGGSLSASESGVANGSEASQPCTATKYPVDCMSGSFFHNFTDLSVPGRGIPLSLTRSYDSLAASTQGIFGYGWSSSYDMHLSVDATSGNATVFQENGATVTFTPLSGGSYSAPPRVLATLVKNADGTFTMVRKARTTFKFSPTGQLISESDLNGYTTTLSYNASGQISTVTDAAGRTLMFTFGANGLVSTVTDPANRAVHYAYDSLGNLTGITDPMGRTSEFTYDSNHLMLTMTDPNNNRITNVYDSSGRVLSQTDPMGLKTTFAYTGSNLSAAGGYTTITDPHGNVEVQNYQYGELTSITKGYGTPVAATWSYTYDQFTLQVASKTDPDGHVWTYNYDSQGNQTSSIDPTGAKTSATYNGFDEPLIITDPSGIVTTFTYDGAGNLVTNTVTGVGGSPVATATYTYGDSLHPGDVTQITDPDGHVTNYSYDANGDVVSASTHPSSAETDTTSAVYDLLGRRVCQASANAMAAGTTCPVAGGPRVTGTSTWNYDADSEVSSTTDPSGATTSYAYDNDGNRTQVTDPLGNITLTVYDADNRKTAVTAGYGTTSAATTAYSYDLPPGSGPCSSSVSGATYCDASTNPLGAVTVEYLDAQNRPVEQSPPAPVGSTVNTFDSAGNVLTQQTPAGLATFGYDQDNHLTSISYSNPATGYQPTSNVTYSYDAAGRRIGMTDGTGSSSYSYDSLGRLASSSNGAGSTVAYGYDLDGNLTSLTYPGGQIVTRTYDGASRWTGVTDWQAHTNSFTYDHDGNMISENLANGLTSTSSFDANGLVLSTKDAPASSPSNPLESISYTRDANGQLTQEMNATCTVNVPCANSAYEYDSLNRIGDLTNPYGQFTYDAGSDLTGLPGGTTQTFNNANQVLSSAAPVSTVGYYGYYYNAGTGPVTLSLPKEVQPLDTVIVAISEPNTQSATTPPGYTLVGTYGSSSAGSQRIQVFRHTVTGNETSVTIGFPNGNISGPTGMQLGVYRGLNPANPIDAVSSTSVQSSNKLTLPSVTASLPGDELVMLTGNSSATGTNFEPPSSMTAQDGTDTTYGDGNLTIADELLTNAGPTGQQSGSYLSGQAPLSSVGVLLALKPSLTTYTYDSSGDRTVNNSPLVTHDLAYDQTGRLSAYDGTHYAYNGDGLRMLKTPTAGPAESFTWDISSSQPLLIQDGSINYIYGPGGLPLEQIGAPTITLVGTGANDEPVTGPAKNTITVNFSTTAATNDQIIVGVTENSTTTANIPGYTFVGAVDNPNGAGSKDKLELWRRTATGGEGSVAVNVNVTDHTKAVVAAIYRGVDPANPIDDFQTGFSALAASTVQVPTVNATEPNDRLIILQSALDNTSSATWTPPSGMTERLQETTSLVSAAFADQSLNNPGATGAKTTTLNLGGSASLAAALIALRPQTLYYLHDQRGSTRFLTDQGGNSVASYFYSPYGTGTLTAGSSTLLAANPFGLQGGYTDHESGLIYLINRYYEPATAQFLSMDPLATVTGSPYGYVGNNPLNGADPLGLYSYYFTEDIGPTSQTGSPAFVMDLFKSNPTAIFPFPVTGCSVFYIGAMCTLHPGPSWGHGVGQVEVSSATDTSFTFTVCSSGYFDPPGSTITFSLTQNHGELYLHQKAQAPSSWFFDLIAPQIAQLTWRDQATNLQNYLGTEPSHPSVDWTSPSSWLDWMNNW